MAHICKKVYYLEAMEEKDFLSKFVLFFVFFKNTMTDTDRQTVISHTQSISMLSSTTISGSFSQHTALTCQLNVALEECDLDIVHMICLYSSIVG